MSDLAEAKPIISIRDASLLAALIMLGYIAMAVYLWDDQPLRSAVSDIILPVADGLADAGMLATPS